VFVEAEAINQVGFGDGRGHRADESPSMGFNRRKMEDQRRAVVEMAAAGRRATEPQVLEDAKRLINASERQAKRMPMLFLPTIGAAIAALLT